jgi:hypothetical protein
MLEGLFYQIPSIVFALGALVIMIAGALYGERLWRKRPDDERASSEEGYIVSGVVGLLALLLGFTFSLALDRYEARRALVLEEANSIRTAYMRSQTFGEPHRTRLGRLFVAYARNRVALGSASPGDDEFMGRVALNGNLQRQLWAVSLAAISGQRDDISSAYMDSMNHVIEVGAARRAAREVRVPPRVFFILAIYMTTTAIVLGYVMGPRRRKAIIALLVLTTLSYGLVLDIDDATGGGIRENQRPMQSMVPFLVPPPPA